MHGYMNVKLKCSLQSIEFFEDRVKWRIFLAVLNLGVLLS